MCEIVPNQNVCPERNKCFVPFPYKKYLQVKGFCACFAESWPATIGQIFEILSSHWSEVACIFTHKDRGLQLNVLHISNMKRFFLTMLVRSMVGSQLTQEEFKKSPLVSSVTRSSRECPGTEETEEVRMVEGEKVRAVFIHDYPMLFHFSKFHGFSKIFCPIKWISVLQIALWY